MTARNPIKDGVAIVGVGSTGFTRSSEGRSPLALACEASIKAIRDSGLDRAQIDGVAVPAEQAAPQPQQLAYALGLDHITHYPRTQGVIGFSFVDAVNAVFSGSCDAILLAYPVYRLPWNSRSAARDPYRAPHGPGLVRVPETVSAAVGYTAWASRYMYEYGAKKEYFGYVAINQRTNAGDNPLAAARQPITMDDYLAARMIREPLCMLDMDLPVDGADAFIITTAERARDLPHPPVLVHATSCGLVAANVEDQLPDLRHHGQHVVVDNLRAKSDFWTDGVDLFYPYDGFTIITLAWLENAGWCGPGEAGPFIEQHWDRRANRILIDGRVPVNTHGGGLSEGATRGSGYVREAVAQLRGQAGTRQVPGARSALITTGGFFFNSQGMMLRSA
jgi:acetyl-CoA acetyltransferase